MAQAVGYGMALACIALLVVYGADESAARSGGEGFLPLDTMTRGIGLGTPAIILAFAAFVVTRNDPSIGLGALIAVCGAMVGSGGIMPLLSSPEEVPPLAVGLLAVGAVLVGLGIIKIVKSR